MGVRRVWTADLGHRGDCFPGHAHSVAGLVSCHVVGNDAKERSQCLAVAADPITYEHMVHPTPAKLDPDHKL